MPRTKRPVRSQIEKSTDEDDSFKKLDKLVLEEVKKLESQGEVKARHLELAFRVLLESISKYNKKTIADLKAELHFKEVTDTLQPLECMSRAPSDDGYLTENSTSGSTERTKNHFLAPPTTVRRSTRRSRSADASSRSVMKTATKTVQRRRSRSGYRTPAYNKQTAVNYPAITPKVAPHTPLTVLRQPRVGEMVVSMSGSPVMVPSCYTLQPQERANCNILLQDGTMLSLQPKKLRQSQDYIPFSLMGNDVLNQLKTLKENLDKVVSLGQKSAKK